MTKIKALLTFIFIFLLSTSVLTYLERQDSKQRIVILCLAFLSSIIFIMTLRTYKTVLKKEHFQQNMELYASLMFKRIILVFSFISTQAITNFFFYFYGEQLSQNDIIYLLVSIFVFLGLLTSIYLSSSIGPGLNKKKWYIFIFLAISIPIAMLISNYSNNLAIMFFGLMLILYHFVFSK